MRRAVAYEGVTTLAGTTIQKGALFPSREVIPVSYQAPNQINCPPEVVGQAIDFQRNNDAGEISFDIKLRHKYSEDLLETVNAHVYLLRVEGIRSAVLPFNYDLVTKAEIASVFLSPTPSMWPMLNVVRPAVHNV